MSESPRFRSAELHRLLVESVSEYAIFALDTTGYIRTWNPGAERLKGYRADEIIGRHFSVFYPDEDVRAGKPPRGLERAAREGHFEDEGWRVRKDGSRFWASVVITALRDERGGLVGFAKITRDLTDRRAREAQARQLAAETAARAAAEQRQAEVEALNAQLQEQTAELEIQTEEAQALSAELEEQATELEAANTELVEVLGLAEDARERARETTDVLRAVVDDSPLAIIVLGLGLEVLRWNPAAERLLGWTAGEMLGRSYDSIIPRERWPEHRRFREDALRGLVTMNVETQRNRKDGSLIDVSLSVAVLRDPLGAVRGFAVFMAGITEQRRLEAQLRQAQKMEAVGQLAGGIAHDFNNLLTIITVHTQLALEVLPPDQPVRADLKAVSDAAVSAANLTRQLLAFSRKQLLKPQVLDLNATVDGVLPMLERLIGEDIEIVTRLDPSLGYTTADPTQLEQVLVNLAVNARDAMPQGGVLLIETGDVELDETDIAKHEAEVAPGPYVMLLVGDTGSGMDAATRARIFEPFFTTKEHGRGTGLGLSTVYGIVTQSGGHIAVDSEPGRGTRFRIYLPRTDTEAEPPIAPTPSPAPRRGSEVVLVVEDETALRHIVRRILERQGYTVHTTSNGTEALQVARELGGRIDLVVTDVILPEMSGPVLAEQLAEEWPRLKVLYMSGYTDDDVIRRGLLKPGMTLLGKPFTLDDLGQTVRRILDTDAPPSPPGDAPR